MAANVRRAKTLPRPVSEATWRRRYRQHGFEPSVIITADPATIDWLSTRLFHTMRGGSQMATMLRELPHVTGWLCRVPQGRKVYLTIEGLAER